MASTNRNCKFELIAPSEYPRLLVNLEKHLPDSFMRKFDSFTVFWDRSLFSVDSIAKLFSQLPNLNFDKPYVIPTGSQIIDETVKEILAKEKYSNIPMMSVISCCSMGFVLTIEEESIYIPEIPSEFLLKPLPSTIASFILQHWNVGNSETEMGIKERLLKYRSFGIFKRKQLGDDECDEHPVAWTMQYTCGIIGLTFTLEQYRKKGLAKMVTLALARAIYNLGFPPYLTVDCGSTSALAFHEKIGFKVVGRSGLIIRIPEGSRIDDII